jgi:hypothetical protein
LPALSDPSIRLNLRSQVSLWLTAVSLAASAVLATEPSKPTCALDIRLLDEQSGEPLPGVVRLQGEQGQTIPLAELVNRGQGIETPGPIHDWWVVPRATRVVVPAGPLTFSAFGGLETELARGDLDLSGKDTATLSIPLRCFYHARRRGQIAGNTHLHLMKLTKKQADRYLAEVPLADGLDIVFLSYLERAEADLEYTSNKYSPRDLERLSHDHVHFGHGEEHRHNFGSHGEGYGHILLLDIPYIIQPVSIGPGIMRAGADSPPLQTGIDKARRAGGKVIWAHNLYGFEDIPNWITGRVHANNIYDGSHRGSYQDTFYRYLNVGLRVPFSTGTDWFIYDLSRVYVAADRPITPTEWLERLSAGESTITNGPLIDFSLGGRRVGALLKLAKADRLLARAEAIGRADFGTLELVRNGRVIATAKSRKEGNHFIAKLEQSAAIEDPSWLAARIPPPPADNEPSALDGAAVNEFGGRLFAHTSPIYVQLAGRDVFDSETARGLIEEMKSDLRKIEELATFDDEMQRRGVLQVYEEAIAVLEKRLRN